MNYHCAKFGDFSFSRYGFIVGQQPESHTDTQTRIIATLVGVSKYIEN